MDSEKSVLDPIILCNNYEKSLYGWGEPQTLCRDICNLGA